ncbi:putative opt oligopeptide transporter protein [Eutypa lata UCREL1]|uniref:Putative opt oligopeptide transporter protein n=1 Tax=Eutypa lata (strain UCR-EL1) TaxID=1287681 RepID=M7SED1_EUTLA|nr:putative opt oligopeptide transporter protein [Eutypa lata UCREL1]
MPVDTVIVGGLNPVEGKVISVPTHEVIDEKIHLAVEDINNGKGDRLNIETNAAQPPYDDDGDDSSEDAIIITGADAARHLLPLRDDHEPALTFRSLFLATCLSAFQAVMTQIYYFKPTNVVISGTFIVLIAYFVGNAWAYALPRGDRHEARWREQGGQGKLPRWIRVASFFNHGPWSLKEHSVCAITATSASNASASIIVFAAQDLFYGLPLDPTTVILSVLSIGLFGFVGMSAYEFFPAYIFPWLNSVSIPCLAAMHATGDKAAILTNLFGGATNNEGLGLFALSFDWQYITSFNTSLPLKLQAHAAVGYVICFAAMLGIYYTNVWDALSQPFMSTQLRSEDGSRYPTTEVFSGGVLDEDALNRYGIPRLTGTFAYALFMANAAVGALIAHCFLFWGGDIARAYKSARAGRYDDRHHAHMAKHYQETPWWWYVAILVISFILGLVVVLKENIALPAWAYVVSLLLGIFIAPLSTILYARYGNGIATNNLSKMLAGLLIPGRPVGNMYFAAWSHNVISSCVNLCNDLKMGEYLKIPPRIMFLTQVYGTVLGGFVNYAVMISIVNGNRELLADSDGSSSWSGATIQAYNTNATSWALAEYLYKIGGRYEMVPIGLGVGAGIVAIHRAFAYFVPKIRGFSINEINMPQLIQYAGQVIAGFFTQFYLRNYRPRIFKDYSYLVTGAFDGASLTVLFILSFAVFGAGGPSVSFPTWWGNNVDGNLDLCPVVE